MAYYLPITEHQRKKAVEAAAAAIAARLGTVPKSAARQAAAIAASPGRFLAPKSAPVRPTAARPQVPKFEIDSQSQAPTEPVDAGRAKERSCPPCDGTATKPALKRVRRLDELDEWGCVLPSMTADEAERHRTHVHWTKVFADWRTDEIVEDMRRFRVDYLPDSRCIGTSRPIQERIDHGEELPRPGPSEAWKWPDHSDTDTGEDNAAASVARGERSRPSGQRIDEEFFDVFAG